MLDELDSGLDVDALRACARRIEAATERDGLGVLAITHYSRLLHELRPDHVHVLARGRDPAPAAAPSWPTSSRRTGYAAFGEDEAPTPIAHAPSPTPSPTRSPEPTALCAARRHGARAAVRVRQASASSLQEGAGAGGGRLAVVADRERRGPDVGGAGREQAPRSGRRRWPRRRRWRRRPGRRRRRGSRIRW